MKITKKQWIVGGAVALVLAGGGAGVVANNQAQAQAEKTAQEAKTAHDNLIKDAKKETEKAETFKAEGDVKSAQDAIKKLEEKDKTPLIARVEKVRQNWDLVNKADKAVANAEKTSNDATVKTAQTAIDTLKADMTKAKKSDLQKRLDKVKTTVKNNKAKAQADKAKKEAEAKQKAAAAQTAKSQQTAPTKNTGQDQAAQTSDTVSTASQGTGSQADNSAAYQPTPQTPTGGGTSNGGASNNNVTPSPTPAPTPAPTPDPTPHPEPTPTPTETFTGWVKNKEGQIVWSQGGFKTLDEAGSAATAWCNANATGGGWSSGAY
ncbi:hypothetical protein [Lactococcus petauri]|uniref:Uncharacterized protein n=1 Tax=Lactococcus petauri TaxID=1940789 RepID=A0A252CAW2_9LACT|nr:hypothetical protein [Lactococcus petauri]OUK02219.1 hypothetical protein BZZ03_11325 [Lactococcus petauri]